MSLYGVKLTKKVLTVANSFPFLLTAVLPFADMILLTSSTASALVIASILSIKILGETFNCKYDFTAMLFISLGCGLMILQTNTQAV